MHFEYIDINQSLLPYFFPLSIGFKSQYLLKDFLQLCRSLISLSSIFSELSLLGRANGIIFLCLLLLICLSYKLYTYFKTKIIRYL